MTSSGTTSFAPSIGDLALNAFSRIQIKPAALTQEHMFQLRMEGNLLQAEWSNDGITLWTVDLQTVALTQGTATYTVPASTVMILDAYISTSSPAINRYISPISRTDYASLANPTQQGYPTSYWYDRLNAQTITLWPVPDGGGPYTLSYYRYRQIDDATPAGGLTPEVPYLALDAWAAGLSHRLSRHFAPALEQARFADYNVAYGKFSKQYVENVPLYINVGLSGYYRP